MRFIEERLENVKEDWQTLLDNSRSKNVFVSLPWLSNIYLHADIKDAFVVIIYNDDIPIAGFPVMVPRFRGDLSDVLLHKEFEFNKHFVKLILQLMRRYHEEYFPYGSFLKHDSHLLWDKKLWSHYLLEQTWKKNWSIGLPPHFNTYMARYKSKQRYNIARSKRLLAQGRKLEIDLKCDISQMGAFFNLHEMKWGFRWTQPPMQAFLKGFAKDLGEGFWLNKLSVDGVPIYMMFCAEYNNVLYSLLVGGSGVYTKHSPGIMLHIAIIKEAISRGIKEFDLLKGDSPYKHYLGAIGRPHYLIDLKKDK